MLFFKLLIVCVAVWLALTVMLAVAQTFARSLKPASTFHQDCLMALFLSLCFGAATFFVASASGTVALAALVNAGGTFCAGLAALRLSRRLRGPQPPVLFQSGLVAAFLIALAFVSRLLPFFFL